jgi:hypothetical protein
MKVRNFTSHDYASWAGVESLSPYIASSETMVCVVDGNSLETFHHTEVSDFSTAPYIHVQFPTAGLALLAAMELRGDETSKEILALGGETGWAEACHS